MPFTRKGGDITPSVNIQTGKIDYSWGTDGNPVFDDTKAFAVASLVVQRRGQWISDRLGTRGSEIYKVRNDTRAAPSKLASYALDALQPMLDTGEITGPNGAADPVVIVTGKPGTKRLDITYSTPKAGVVTAKVAL